jgi:hypothetical protein
MTPPPNSTLTTETCTNSKSLRAEQVRNQQSSTDPVLTVEFVSLFLFNLVDHLRHVGVFNPDRSPVRSDLPKYDGYPHVRELVHNTILSPTKQPSLASLSPK